MLSKEYLLKWQCRNEKGSARTGCIVIVITRIFVVSLLAVVVILLCYMCMHDVPDPTLVQSGNPALPNLPSIATHHQLRHRTPISRANHTD